MAADEQGFLPFPGPQSARGVDVFMERLQRERPELFEGLLMVLPVIST